MKSRFLVLPLALQSRGIDAALTGLLPTTTAFSPSSASSAAANALASVQGPIASWLSDLPYLALRIEAAFVTQSQSLLQQLGLPNPELQYYGKSPPVYPAPIGNGQGGWADAYSRAKALAAQMTTEEKASLMLGNPGETNGCSGFITNVSRVGFPGLCLNDAESGVRTAQLVSGFPSQIHVGASWNRDLAGDRALWLGREFKAKGVNVVLGPVGGPLGRMARGGRNWEGFTNDPYLSGSLIGPTVTGLQKSVIACGKHFIANEQETYRSPFAAGLLPGLSRQSVSANVDDRTIHELYMWPFYDAVRAEIGSVMCSYNRVNNSYACQNSKTMNGLLKTELGFQGFVVSDWYGSLTGIAGNNAGLDMSMPYSQYLTPSVLAQAVRNGSVAASRLDDAATRILAAMYRYAPIPNPGISNYATVNAQDPASAPTLLQSAIEGHVLVKNLNSALPFTTAPKTLNLFGWDAINITSTQKSDSFAYGYALANTQHYPNGQPFGDVDIAAGFLAVQPDPSNGPPTAYDGTLHVGGGSGGTTPDQVHAPYDSFAAQAAQDGTTLNTDFTSTNPTVVDPSTAPCIVFVNSQSLEAWDRAALSDPKTDSLVLSVANRCANTIVVLHNAGISLVDAWIDHPNVTAAIFAHLPGQESGPALVELFYGRQSFSGRLPYTVAKKAEDYGSLLNPDGATLDNPMYPQSNFDEGLFIDYRSFVQRGVQPRFDFGFGLTYSQFEYSNLVVGKVSGADFSGLPPDSASGSPIPQGGLDSLYDVLATAQVDVTNVGKSYEAAEVAQLYLGIPGSTVQRQLRGFDKQTLKPGEKKTFTFQLRRRDLSVWDVVAQQWRINSGDYGFMVGKSVNDLKLNGTLTI